MSLVDQVTNYIRTLSKVQMFLSMATNFVSETLEICKKLVLKFLLIFAFFSNNSNMKENIKLYSIYMATYIYFHKLHNFSSKINFDALLHSGIKITHKWG